MIKNFFFDLNVCIPQDTSLRWGINALNTEPLLINACYNMVIVHEHFGIQTKDLFVKKTHSWLLLEWKHFQIKKVQKVIKC